MIHIDITAGPDENVRADFKYFLNQIYLGRTAGDLWINDPDIRPSHVMLEVIGKELLIHPQKDVEFYLINGKRSSSIRKLKVNDEVTMGGTVLKVLGFEETQVLTKKVILERKLEKLVDENSKRLPVIEKLTTLMKT